MLRKVNEQGIHVLGTHCMMISNVRNGIHTEHQESSVTLKCWVLSLLQNKANQPNVQPMYKFHQALPNSLYLPAYPV